MIVFKITCQCCLQNTETISVSSDMHNLDGYIIFFTDKLERLGWNAQEMQCKSCVDALEKANDDYQAGRDYELPGYEQ